MRESFIYFVIRDLSAWGGAEKIAAELAEGLAEKNRKIKILTSRRNLTARPGNRVRNADISVVSLFVPGIRFAGTLIYYLVFGVYLAVHFSEYRILQVFFLKHSAFISALAGRTLNKKVICRLECAGECGDVKGLDKIPFRRFFLRILKGIDVFIALTPQIKEELLSAGFANEKIIVIPNGVDTERFSPVLSEKKRQLRLILGLPAGRIVTFAGRLASQKGLEYLLNAVKKFPDGALHLLIIGEGPMGEMLCKSVQSAGLSGKVILAGFRENVLPYLQASDAFVLPSISEGLSLALLEAMSCGLPVVATEVSGNIDLIKDGINGFLVKPGDSVKLAEALGKILRDEALAEKMGGINRRKIVEGYAFSRIVERYMELYNHYEKILT